MPNQFELDTDDVLGFAYSEYISSIRGIAISKPGDYFRMRAEVQKEIKRLAVGALYKTIFAALSKGQKPDGTALYAPLCLGQGLTPGYPSQKINDFAIETAATLGEALNKVVDLLLPADFDHIASAKLTIKGKSSAIDV